MPHAQSGDVRIFYTVDGPEDAPALVFSNSLGATHRMWDGQIAALKDRFRIIRYDRRGHGQSDNAGGDYTIEMLGREGLAVMDAAGVAKAHWCGLSIGGMAGLWIAANAPERIECLVAASAATHLPTPEVWNGRIRTAANRGIEPLADPTMGMWFTKAFLKSDPEAVAKIRAGFVETTVEGFSGCCAAMRDMDLREMVREIAAPTLVIAGSDDAGTTPADQAVIVSRVPDARGVILKASHIVNVEQAAAFNAALSDFLDA